MKHLFVISAALALCCILVSCGSGAADPSGSDEELTSVSLVELTYSVPASWDSTVDGSASAEDALSGNMHTDIRGGLDLMVDRYSWDYNGGYITARDELETAGEYVIDSNYEENGAYIPGIKYKMDSGAWRYIYEIETEPAVFRLTFTLQTDENVRSMTAVLGSCAW